MSIVEVAKIAGLSHSTVSRVINGRPGVAPQTAIAVQKAMRTLGYTPPARRPGPRPRDRVGVTTGNIALLMIGTNGMFAKAPVTATVFHAAEQALADRGFNLFVSQMDDAGRLPPNVARGQIDGLLLHGFAPPPGLRTQIEQHPAVWLLSQRSPRGYWGDRVCPDNEWIGRLAAEHLVKERGCTRIAYLYFSGSHAGFRTRASEFAMVARDLGASAVVVPDEKNTSILDAYSEELGEDETESIVEQLLACDPLPDGIFVPRDRLTVKVYRALRSRGIEPGRDIEVVSCDDEPILEALDPRPTTIDVRPDLIGRYAVEQLIARINDPGHDARSTVTVRPRLVTGSDHGRGVAVADRRNGLSHG